MASSSRIPLLLVLCGLALPGVAAAADVGKEVGAPPGEPVGALNEVTVIGKKLRDLERETTRAEDRFYKRFNTLNSHDDYDIHCRMYKETGTLIPQRQCRVRFLVAAEAVDARDFLTGLTTGAAARGVNTPVAAVQMEWVRRREEYRQAARALLEKDPELMALATEWLRLRQQYDRVYRERHKDKVILFE